MNGAVSLLGAIPDNRSNRKLTPSEGPVGLKEGAFLGGRLSSMESFRDDWATRLASRLAGDLRSGRDIVGSLSRLDSPQSLDTSFLVKGTGGPGGLDGTPSPKVTDFRSVLLGCRTKAGRVGSPASALGFGMESLVVCISRHDCTECIDVSRSPSRPLLDRLPVLELFCRDPE